MIGILGGNGAVGQQVVRLLHKWNIGEMRIGVRSKDVHTRELKEPSVYYKFVDIEDAQSLSSFVDGCEMLINCAGPSKYTSVPALKAALHGKIHYIDAGGEQCISMLADCTSKQYSLIFSAGALPGISGLLPRWLAQRFIRPVSLKFYCGILDRFTLSGAEDFLDGIYCREGNASSLSKFRGKPEIVLPFFPRPVTLAAYHDGETSGVQNSLGLENAEFYIARDGKYVNRALLQMSSSSRIESVRTLCEAANLDLSGLTPYILYLLQMDGIRHDNQLKSYTLMLKGAGVSAMTGSMVASVTMSLLRRDIENRIGLAAEVCNPDPIIDGLNDPHTGNYLQVLDCTIDDLLQTAGGVL
ncbi:hypothetical protein GQ117_001257 [Salmonella enterica]|nr:hypothetical protein [Salmonella enterica]